LRADPSAGLAAKDGARYFEVFRTTIIPYAVGYFTVPPSTGGQQAIYQVAFALLLITVISCSEATAERRRPSADPSSWRHPGALHRHDLLAKRCQPRP
jgi:hypothetical protein